MDSSSHPDVIGLIMPLLSNRAGSLPADGWFHLVPLGRFPHSSGKTQLIDEPAIDAMVNAFQPRLLVDQEHWSYDTTRSSEAFGWVEAVEKRADGLWGKIDWSDLGQAAIANTRYRFISPVWLSSDTRKLPDDAVRPLRLDSLGLTNSPNLRGMVPLWNRAASAADPGETAADVWNRQFATSLKAPQLSNRTSNLQPRSARDHWNSQHAAQLATRSP